VAKACRDRCWRERGDRLPALLQKRSGPVDGLAAQGDGSRADCAAEQVGASGGFPRFDVEHDLACLRLVGEQLRAVDGAADAVFASTAFPGSLDLSGRDAESNRDAAGGDGLCFRLRKESQRQVDRIAKLIEAKAGHHGAGQRRDELTSGCRHFPGDVSSPLGGRSGGFFLLEGRRQDSVP